MKQKTVILLAIFVSLALVLGAVGGAAVSLAIGQTTMAEPAGTAFTYQGRLNDVDGPAGGAYDFDFRLYTAASGEDQVGPTVNHNDVAVSDGLFTVLLDFGAGVFDGEARYLEIRVRPAGEGGFTILDPRQPLTAAPYALYSHTAPWDGLIDVPAGFADGVDDDTLATLWCNNGQVAKWDGGNWVCAADDDTTYSAGFGLALSDTQFAVLTDTIQQRIDGSCAIGQYVRAINTDGTIVCGSDAPLNRSQAPLTNTMTILDNVGDGNGRYTSVTIGIDGLPIISYYAPIAGALQVAHCDDATCSSFTLSTVDDVGDVGEDSSIAIGTDGLPIISYRDNTTGDRKLKVAHCHDVACNGATITTLASGGVAGWFTSIAIGTDGLPIISYYHSGVLKVAHCNDAACTSATISEPTVDVDDFGGLWTSIAIGIDGLPIISYYDGGSGEMKVAHCDDVVCSSATMTVLDNGTSPGTSITIGTDGLALISYVGTGSNFKVAHCNDVACTSATITSIVNTSPRFHSITIGANGLGVIAYSHFAGGIRDVKVAYCHDLACTGVTTTTLDSLDNSWFDYTSITIGTDGHPFISYYDNDNELLKAVHCGSALCIPNFRRR